jgi:hypothetical protein
MPHVICARCLQRAKPLQGPANPVLACANCHSDEYLLAPIRHLVAHLDFAYSSRRIEDGYHFALSLEDFHPTAMPDILVLPPSIGNANTHLAKYLEHVSNFPQSRNPNLKIINQSGQEIDANLKKMLGERLVEG